MELRTTFNIEPSLVKITYNDPVMFIGSCFASEMGDMMQWGRMPVMINPAGAVYNPVSVSNTLDLITSAREFSENDLYNHNGTYLSLYHYTDFNSSDPSAVLEKINLKSREASEFLKRARFLFITFGTARVYRWKESGSIVSNCHKIPSENFEQDLLTVNSIVSLWSQQLDKLASLFPHLKIIFTISPVRHWKDGAHGNQVSKAILFNAVEELLKHRVSPQYFPAYELLMDDLRDYRFYDDDMLHPSPVAINYIWDAFSGSYMDNKTLNTWNTVLKITKATKHLIKTDSRSTIIQFAKRIIRQIDDIEGKVPGLNLSADRTYFNNLIKEP